MTPPALHRGMVAVDIVAFGRRDDPDVQVHLRDSVHRLTERACRAAGVGWDERVHHEDRGDGLFVITGTDISVTTLLTALIPELLNGVRRHNRLASPLAQLRLRAAVHAGFVLQDAHGATGTPLNELFRLLEAPAFREAMETSAADFGVVVSDYLFSEVVRHNGELASGYHPVPVEVKETRMRGWVWLPAKPLTAPAGIGRELAVSDLSVADLSSEDLDVVAAVVAVLLDALRHRAKSVHFQ